jgi:hypothetical protein
MDKIRDVAVIVGSLRKHSINLKVPTRSPSWRPRG